MADKFYSERNLKFLLYEVFDAASLTKYDYYSEHNKKMFDMVLAEADKLAKKMMRPILEEMDRNPPELEDGSIRVHDDVRKILDECGKGGWITASKPVDHGGDQLPLMITDSCQYIFCAANYSAAVYPGLNAGASHLIEEFGSEDLKETYLPNLHNGTWQGTMALTEPGAGSSLSDLETSAEPTEEGYYLIRGQKIFISAGDHNCVDNVVHLMLAKIKGGPPGVKGISLFVVPKFRPALGGGLEPNDVVASGVYHKMGYRGAPIAQLSMGDGDNCRGWLVGEPHKGLFYMFQMMNEARLGVGLGATAIASAAYYAALEYCRERRQGRKIGQKDPTQPQVPIIEHADIRRALLFQKAIIEGSHSLLLQGCKYADMMRVTTGEEQERYSLLLDLLTPVAKTYPSEMGIQAVSQGLQCFGGSGYCDDYPLEQYYRDMRIHPIHEGTTAIHGLDILGRKVVMKEGKAFAIFKQEVLQTVQNAEADSELKGFGGKLKAALEVLDDATRHLLNLASKKGPEYYLADATLYLELFGIVTIAWQWLVQGLAASKALSEGAKKKDVNFYNGKILTLKYFYAYELPKITGLSIRLLNTDGLTVDLDTAIFND
ncbi:Acyl-CoA dehydrogenase domain protein [Desulfatibacillum aliphaticivorans]|uniref:Acyl-CoA dehydrogenase domain protein n=1 Tax=Desulfatibacillum aliphaticivorans TaxID=218208 RepID=B8FJ99_DESAL|nr:acyl-CoA dehydrogenase [Desulfatibacillum aliphaticivorans]ACL05026.1 Acyl-CoA dehydrogenase domain protein [Desulfatibacillum aliphaticivorans]